MGLCYGTPGVNILEFELKRGKTSPQWFNDTNDADNDAYLLYSTSIWLVIVTLHKLCVGSKISTNTCRKSSQVVA